MIHSDGTDREGNVHLRQKTELFRMKQPGSCESNAIKILRPGLRVFLKSSFVSLNQQLNTVQVLLQLVFDMQKKYKEIRTPSSCCSYLDNSSSKLTEHWQFRCVRSVDINKVRAVTPACLMSSSVETFQLKGKMKDDVKTVSMFQDDNNHQMK